MDISPTKRLVNEMEDDIYALKDAADTLHLFVQGVATNDLTLLANMIWKRTKAIEARWVELSEVA